MPRLTSSSTPLSSMRGMRGFPNKSVLHRIQQWKIRNRHSIGSRNLGGVLAASGQLDAILRSRSIHPCVARRSKMQADAGSVSGDGVEASPAPARVDPGLRRGPMPPSPDLPPCRRDDCESVRTPWRSRNLHVRESPTLGCASRTSVSQRGQHRVVRGAEQKILEKNRLGNE